MGDRLFRLEISVFREFSFKGVISEQDDDSFELIAVFRRQSDSGHTMIAANEESLTFGNRVLPVVIGNLNFARLNVAYQMVVEFVFTKTSVIDFKTKKRV